VNARRAVTLLGVAAIVLAHGAGSIRAATAPDRSAPTLTLSTSAVKPGDTVRVDGTGWQPSTNVKLEICGNQALDGTVDCDQPSSRIVRTFTTGPMVGELRVGVPPKPCPCVVRATELNGRTSVTAPLVIEGVPTAPPKSEAPLDQGGPTLRIADATVEGSTSITSLVGGAAARTLVLRVRNTADFAVPDVLATASWSKGGGSGHVILSKRIAEIPAGATRTVRLPFDLDALSFGTYTVSGSVGLVGNRVRFATETSQYPWILIGVLLLLVLAIVALVVRAVRRRRARRRAATEAELKATRLAKNGDGWNTKKGSPKARRAAKAKKQTGDSRESELVT
jgi:hypothetical protein